MNNVPQHIAIIMDGNRRWAREQGFPPLSGHQKVANEILEPLIEHASQRGVKFVTFWAFSTENWRRSKFEVAGIMRIFRHMIKDRWQRLHEKGVRMRVIGDISKFPRDIQKALVDVVEQTKNNKKITAVFALNYGGRDEILRTIKRLDTQEPTEENFSEHLDTAGIPDPEMIVRTSGEQRLSGFLLWQSEYSELYFPAWHMPEFSPEKLDEVLVEYAKRQRRFGK
ncbi:di-trans,poly-cis-decaprenylcistransferase [Candidatus Gottesmanbacteria bacterium RIFCSPHIGHO2_01_FULL_46_14]|uniref:Isoprenyl transferase n=2 Tax=Candidatus Gottesmaniibacteriota TaxID=1752720 RepID=A0A1F5ZP92_9BACT|nr:MAG: di-trans,poly-cis-decaprenylcistransferase [Candidatus Gottesmanbacteria bacterium RIFCSPHIGHO2_01_FULL_46_14]OGG29448.1 MAG: di-trans,poly-cis-decaprenylcistransferase [Candidatus Gottesmanbacteria bacterium RIFCSPLOWO2_01_FULL_46_21]